MSQLEPEPQPQPTEDPDAPESGEGEHEGEHDEPQGVRHDPAAVGERIREAVEREPDADADAEPAPELPPRDAYTRTCSHCDGYGQTVTGSRVEGQEFRQCPICQGVGFLEAHEASPERTSEPRPEPEGRGVLAGHRWEW